MKKVLSFLMAILIVGSVVSSVSFQSFATNKTREEALNWVRGKVGQGIDYDGAYGNQCVDLIMAYYAYLGVSPASGNGADYTWNALPSGWQRLQGAQPQPGDILVYTGGYGHVAIYEADRITYHQNFGSPPAQYVVKVTYKYNGISNPYWGVIRPNFASQPSTPTNYFTSVGVSNVGADDARIEGTINLTYVQSCGFYLGTNTNSMQRVAEATNANTNKIWFDLKSYRGALQSGTTYYYKLFVVINGTEYGSEIKSFKTTSTHQHSYTSIVTKSPTCTATGVRTYKCSCGNSYTESILALGHNFSKEYTIDTPATCAKEGSKSYHCSRCNATTGSIAIPKTGHKYISNITKQPTCTEEGINVYTCSCGDSYVASIIPLGHNFSTEYTVDTPATCAKEGSKSYHCSRCNATTGSVAILKTEHTYGDWVVTQQATEAQEGIRIRQCAVCGNYETEIFGVLIPVVREPGKVTGITAQVSSNSITLNWAPVGNASGYRVYKYNPSNGKFEKVKTLDNTTYYKVTGLNPSTSYSFRVVAYDKDYDNGDVAWGEYSDVYTVKTSPASKKPAQVTGLKMTARTATAVSLKWNKAADAQIYYIFKYNKKQKKYIEIGSTKGTTFTAKKLLANTDYMFAVQAANTIKNKECYGKVSSLLSVKTDTDPAQVTGLKVTARTANAVSLKWNKSAGAQVYYIFKYNKKAKKYIEIGSTKGTTFTAKKLLANTDYMFAVQAGKTVGKKEYYGKVSSLISVKTDTDPAQVTGLKAASITANTVSLKWNKAAGAQRYYVFIYNTKTKKYKEIGYTTGTTFKIKKLKGKTNYKFAVQAAKTVSKRERYGKVSGLLSVKTK